ncbi:hypothetical protein [Hymenobacter rubripertinctus]|uniref:Uncharacterized protein n=1 Tax=Hymenobacter rubripertinctus TaxID=2029981 RepID=A0A418R8X3_9BACT|nr:hypothetical protein [Hymenobacter rubripertinctus]RIY13744.1 hypothetical protein D0T11_01290 [Hymenobacter rubripertinctus]
MLTESTHLMWLSRQECADSALAIPLPDPCEAPAAAGRVEQKRQAFGHQLWALLTPRGIGHGRCRPEPEPVDDYLPYEVVCLPEDMVRHCRDHIVPRLEEGAPQAEAKTWQLIFLASLAANNHLLYCDETGAVSVSRIMTRRARGSYDQIFSTVQHPCFRKKQ